MELLFKLREKPVVSWGKNLASEVSDYLSTLNLPVDFTPNAVLNIDQIRGIYY